MLTKYNFYSVHFIAKISWSNSDHVAKVTQPLTATIIRKLFDADTVTP
jgi:hypothetical protein